MYSLIERTPERELLSMARSLDIGVTAWSPLGMGVLAGKYNKDNKNKEPKRFDPNHPMASTFVNERNISIAKEVQTISNEIGKTPSQVALNWIINQKHKGVIIPILGVRTQAQIIDNLGCLEFELESEHMKRLDEKSKIELGFPYDFISSDVIRNQIYGNLYSSIEYHRLDM